MARNRSALNGMARLARDLDRINRAQIRDQQREAREAQRAQQAYLKAQKENYVESRVALTALRNRFVELKTYLLQTTLQQTLHVDDHIDFETFKTRPEMPKFNLARPDKSKYVVSKPSGFNSLLPWKKEEYLKAVEDAKRQYKADVEAYIQEGKRHNEIIKQVRIKVQAQHQEVDQFKAEFENGNPKAIVDYFSIVLMSSNYLDEFPQHAKLAYIPESNQLIIEYDLPTMEVIPLEKSFRYIKSRDEIVSTLATQTHRRTLYGSIIAQIALRTIHEVFESDRRIKHIDTIVFNGYVEAIDTSTGQPKRPCLITVRTTRDIFLAINLAQVDPEACLKGLNASASRKPEELAPVHPVLDLNMVDARFIEETDVLSNLDQRINLMDITLKQFGSLITNLFQKMGLEIRQTQSPHDGWVDYVAFDPRPIFGGKMVIQAKRYKGTVGVSVVSDLFGTLQNEGASMGVLVTTSDYGKESFEFAKDKPIELLNGANLLYLLKEHARIDAKIVPPDDWVDEA